MEDFNFTIGHNMVQFYGHVYINETLDRPLEGLVFLDKCNENMEDCKYFAKVPYRSACDYLDDAMAMRKSFFRFIKPKLSCPIAAVGQKNSVPYDAF
jgi:hypothetical protein